MRNQRDIAPNRYKTAKISGSNKFVSVFSDRESNQGIVEKRSGSYNWTSYKWAVGFTLVIGFFTYLAIDYLMF